MAVPFLECHLTLADAAAIQRRSTFDSTDSDIDSMFQIAWIVVAVVVDGDCDVIVDVSGDMTDIENSDMKIIIKKLIIKSICHQV